MNSRNTDVSYSSTTSFPGDRNRFYNAINPFEGAHLICKFFRAVCPSEKLSKPFSHISGKNAQDYHVINDVHQLHVDSRKIEFLARDLIPRRPDPSFAMLHSTKARSR